MADRLNMCSHTIIEIENCKSNPKFETVALIAEEMNISLDGIVFHDKVSQTVPKCVEDFFANKSEKQSRHTEIHRFMSKCGKTTINSCFQNCSIEKQKRANNPCSLLAYRLSAPVSMRPALVLLSNFNHDSYQLRNPPQHNGQLYHQFLHRPDINHCPILHSDPV